MGALGPKPVFSPASDPPQLPVTKTLADLEAELAEFRRRHKIGANKKLAEVKRIRTAMLREELDRGKCHVVAHVKSKPRQRQPQLELAAA